MPRLLTEELKCKQIVSVTERRGLSVMKLVYDLHTVHTTILQKRKKTVSITHTAVISINYTTTVYIKI